MVDNQRRFEPLPIIGGAKTEDDMMIQPFTKMSYQKVCEVVGPQSGKQASRWLQDQKFHITTPVPLQEFLFLLLNCKKLKVGPA